VYLHVALFCSYLTPTNFVLCPVSLFVAALNEKALLDKKVAVNTCIFISADDIVRRRRYCDHFGMYMCMLAR